MFRKWVTSGLIQAHAGRCISTTSVSRVKEIKRMEEGDKIVISAEIKPSPREKYLIPQAKSNVQAREEGQACSCPICALGLHIQHTDVLIIRQFMDSTGQQIPMKITGLCKQQHRRMDYLIVMAEKAGLIPRCNKDGTKRDLIGWEQNNKYYDEEVIEEWLTGRSRRNRA